VRGGPARSRRVAQAGTLSYIVDTIDVVANCETVEKPGAAPASDGGDAPAGADPAAKLTGKLSIRTIASRGLGVSVPAPARAR
jgi:hypothetical protein